MDAFSWESIANALNRSTNLWISAIDILLVTAVIFSGFLLIRGTRAVQVLRGFVGLALIVLLLSSIPGLTAFRQLVSWILPTLLLSIPIIFQPELRRALEQLGRTGSFFRFLRKNEVSPVVIAVKDASLRLSQRRHGALIVFERDTGLQEYIDTGILLNSEVSPDLLLTIFNKNTELHDGAVIMRNDRLAAAACGFLVWVARSSNPIFVTKFTAGKMVNPLCTQQEYVHGYPQLSISLAYTLSKIFRQ